MNKGRKRVKGNAHPLAPVFQASVFQDELKESGSGINTCFYIKYRKKSKPRDKIKL